MVYAESGGQTNQNEVNHSLMQIFGDLDDLNDRK